MAIKNNRINLLVQIICLILMCFFTYSNSITGKFIYDDITLIKYNDYIKDWVNLPQALTDNIGAGSGNQSNFNRPVQIISYMLDYSIWGLNPVGYHITNIILHSSVTLCIFWLVSLIFGHCAIPLALLTSLLYSAHPIHSEAVAYISGRADSLAALFTLLTIIFYLKTMLTKQRIWFLLLLISYSLALFSKEYTLIIFVLLLLYSHVFKREYRIKELIILLLITLIYLIPKVAIFQLNSLAAVPTTVLQRLPGFFIAIFEYIRLLLSPFNLHLGYGNPVFNFSEPRAIFGLGLSLLLLVFAFLKKYQRPLFSFAILWFFITLLPQSNLYPLNAFMAEHWLYLPSLGFFLILAFSLTGLYNKFKYLGLILMTGILTFYSYSTIKQNSYWQDPVSFYKRSLIFDGNNWNLYYNLGMNLEQKGDFNEAIIAYREALAINPFDINIYYHLSNSYYRINNAEKSVGLLKRVIEMSADNPLGYYWLGNLYTNIKQIDEAIEAYNRALQVDQNFALAYISLGKIFMDLADQLQAQKMFNQAAILLEKAVGVEPNFAAAQANLAVAYYYAGQPDLAIKHCAKAMQLGYDVTSEFPEMLKLLKSE